MGKKKSRQKRFRALQKAINQPSEYPKSIREKKANEVRLQLALLGLNDCHNSIKKVNIILDLWVNHNREHQELIDLPFVENKKLEVKLYNNQNQESKVILKHICSY
jgi:hypothetical protein